LVERRVVVLADLVGIGHVEPHGIDVGRVVSPLEIGWQIPVWHQVEHADLHGSTSSAGNDRVGCYAQPCCGSIWSSDRLLRYSTTVMARRGRARKTRSGEIAGLVSTAPELRPSEDDFADLTSGSMIRVVLVSHCLQHEQHRVD